MLILDYPQNLDILTHMNILRINTRYCQRNTQKSQVITD